MAKAKTWREKDVKDWNVRNFHDYLTYITKEKYGVTYAPFGQGSIGERWKQEQGNLKFMIRTHGAVITKAWIHYCVDNYTPSADYPYISFGFMFAYLRQDIAKVEAQLTRRAERAIIAEAEMKEADDDWF